MLILSEEQVRERLSVDEVVSSLEKMFGRDYRKTANIPLRTTMQAFGGSTCLFMPCSDSALPGVGLKVVTVRNGGSLNGDRVQADCFLLEPESLKVCAMLSANYLTEVRTAAVSAIATRALARTDSRTLGVFGTGRQALAHLLLLSRDKQFQRLLVCGSQRSRSERFAESLAEHHRLQVEPVDAATCAKESDVICTCTTSSVPLFDGELVHEGTHLNLVGTFQPENREVDDALVARSRIVVDSYEGALSEAGDLMIPLNRGIITNDHIIADLHEIVSRKVVGRKDTCDITLFKSVGFALEDLVVATLLYERERRK
jgi:ornithine cyclodeaminase/alanine dehydrogenase-like protein (mu-crystallin family)